MPVIELTERAVRRFSRGLHILGSSFLLIVTSLILAHILSRSLFDEPIGPTYELTGLFVVILIAFCWGYTTLVGGHVHIEFVLDRFPTAMQNIANIFTSLLSFGVFGVMAWAQVELSLQLRRAGGATDLIHIPYFPFALVLGFGALVICLVAFFQIFHALGRTLKRE